jgi:hypothetical protein
MKRPKKKASELKPFEIAFESSADQQERLVNGLVFLIRLAQSRRKEKTAE